MERFLSGAIVNISYFCLVNAVLFECIVGSYTSTSSPGCSREDLTKIQTGWHNLMTSTSPADKVAIFDSVVDYVRERNVTVANRLIQGHSTHQEPRNLVAYRFFSDIDIYLNTYSDSHSFRGHIQHLAATRNGWAIKLVTHIGLLFDAISRVMIHVLISAREDKFLWTTCLEVMAIDARQFASHTTNKARCDVIPTSGDPSYPIDGSITFSQLAQGGYTLIHVNLAGFPVVESTHHQTAMKSSKHALHIHEHGSIDDRCLKAGPHFNPHGKQHGSPSDSTRHVGDLGNISPGPDGRVIYAIQDSLVSLHGVNDVINRTVVIHKAEDDLGRGGHSDSLTTGHAGARIACCVIQPSFD